MTRRSKSGVLGTPAEKRHAYNLYMREYMLARYRQIRAEYLAQLGGKCVYCGAVDRLQFDHIDPSTKLFTISGQGWSKSKTRLDAEVRKCQLLCESCHTTKTLHQKGLQSAKGQHGTISSYKYCRCNACKAAAAAQSREYRKRVGRRKRSK